MNQISNAIYEIHHMDTIASRDQWVNRIHPLVKFVLTVVYIAVVVSFSKYDLIGLMGMVVYPLAGFILADLSFMDSLKRLRIVLPLVCLIGIWNPFFDQVPLQIGGITVNGGVISMFTLILKGIFTVLAAYLLIATTTIEKICYALHLLHVPGILITQFLLTYRYVTVLLKEVNRITQAYSLRAPNQKGIHYKVWGSLTGQVLLRSMDRANAVYESMMLRGYDGSFAYMGKDIRISVSDVIYLLLWLAVFVIFRKYP
ncbi:MAG: cobalt ECF transporter T component CbiQ, partial [Lachnospiraceae bacterium]|nr:cobalt ECF transporter T component CbiQ [Lachnospiraceae bacterium]